MSNKQVNKLFFFFGRNLPFVDIFGIYDGTTSGHTRLLHLAMEFVLEGQVAPTFLQRSSGATFRQPHRGSHGWSTQSASWESFHGLRRRRELVN